MFRTMLSVQIDCSMNAQKKKEVDTLAKRRVPQFLGSMDYRFSVVVKDCDDDDAARIEGLKVPAH